MAIGLVTRGKWGRYAVSNWRGLCFRFFHKMFNMILKLKLFNYCFFFFFLSREWMHPHWEHEGHQKACDHWWTHQRDVLWPSLADGASSEVWAMDYLLVIIEDQVGQKCFFKSYHHTGQITIKGASNISTSRTICYPCIGLSQI